MIKENSFDVLCLTETWLKPNDCTDLNESTPPSYCYKHKPRQTGRGGGVARGAATDYGPPVQHIHSGPPAFRGGGGVYRGISP